MVASREDLLYWDNFDAVLAIINAELLQNDEEFEEETQPVLKKYLQQKY